MRIFISYSRGDREIASVVADRLKAEGHTVWWDHELRGGDEYPAEILAQLKASEVAVVIWTANSVRSNWVRDEADEALGANRLIPIIHPALARTDIPLGFRHLQMIPLDQLEALPAALAARSDGRLIGEQSAKARAPDYWNIVKNPLFYVALSTALIAYVVFPGFLAGIALGLLFALVLLFWLGT